MTRLFHYKRIFLLFSVIVSLLPILSQAATTTTRTETIPSTTTTPVVTPQPNSLTGVGPIDSGQLTPPPDVNAKGYILMDANSGQILAAKNPDARLAPASTTKIMSMYVISRALKNGKIRLNDLVTVSREAWKTGGSRMFIQVGSQVAVQDLINGIVVASGNDAAVAMAEYIGGNQPTFVDMMNQSAASLGMKNSHFMDVNGLPAPDHYSSPRDLALVAQALINEFPDFYKAWYSQKWFEFNKIKQANRNQLLWRDPTVDGLKTGHTDAAGYCLVASAQRNGMRLISVIMGDTSPSSRSRNTEALLNWGFHNFTTHQLYAANQPLAEPRIWMGDKRTVPMGIVHGLYVTIPNGEYKNLKATLTLDNNLQAPIVKNQKYGVVDVYLNNKPILSQPIVALQDNPVGGLLTRTVDHVLLMFHHMD